MRQPHAVLFVYIKHAKSDHSNNCTMVNRFKTDIY